MLLKIGYYLMSDIRNKSSMTDYAIPFNMVCACLTLLFIYLKFNELKDKKSIDSNDPGSVDTKKFHT